MGTADRQGRGFYFLLFSTLEPVRQNHTGQIANCTKAKGARIRALQKQRWSQNHKPSSRLNFLPDRLLEKPDSSFRPNPLWFCPACGFAWKGRSTLKWGFQ